MKWGQPLMRKGITREHGFTALEIIIAVMVLGFASLAFLSGFGPYLDHQQREDTRLRLRGLREAFSEAYRRELLTISVTATPGITIGGVAITNNTDVSGAVVGALSRLAAVRVGRDTADGFNLPIRVFVSNELVRNLGEATLRYRAIALVSPGRNGRVESTFDTATGVLTPAGDDEAETLNGFAIIRDAYDETVKRIERVAGAYQSYFTTRFLADPSRNPAVDYFASTDPAGILSPNWDQDGTIATTGAAGPSAIDTLCHVPRGGSRICALDALGLDASAARTAYGASIQIENASGDVNHPDNASAARRLPPFSARVSAALPGGERIVRTVIGAFQ